MAAKSEWVSQNMSGPFGGRSLVDAEADLGVVGMEPWRQGRGVFPQESCWLWLVKRVWPLRCLVPVILTAVLAGCAHPPAAPPPTTGSGVIQYQGDLFLSLKEPQKGNIRLLAIAPDGKTTIRVVDTGEELEAVPRAFFVSRKYGTQGIQLLWASAERGEVGLRQRWTLMDPR